MIVPLLLSVFDQLILVLGGAFLAFAPGSFFSRSKDPAQLTPRLRLLRICGWIMVGSGLLVAVPKLIGPGRDLTLAVAKVNANVPRMVDEATRLEGAAEGPGRRITYKYTLLPKKASEIDQAVWVEFEHVLRKAALDSQAVITMLEAGVIVAYQYSGNDKQLIGEVTFVPGDEKKRGASSKTPEPAPDGVAHR